MQYASLAMNTKTCSAQYKHIKTIKIKYKY